MALYNILHHAPTLLHLHHPTTFQRAASVTERETRSHYQQLLAALEHHCAQIIASTEQSQEVVAQARQVQERLYDAFNKVRDCASSNCTVGGLHFADVVHLAVTSAF